MKFRKKPVVIEAFQWVPKSPAWESPEWFYEACSAQACWPEADDTLTIKTLGGNMTGQIGDWIIKGVKGELYPCKPDIFEATYEKAD